MNFLTGNTKLSESKKTLKLIFFHFQNFIFTKTDLAWQNLPYGSISTLFSLASFICKNVLNGTLYLNIVTKLIFFP